MIVKIVIIVKIIIIIVMREVFFVQARESIG